MNKTFILSVITASMLLFGCKSKNKDQAAGDTTVSSTTQSSSSSSTEPAATSPANEPKTYSVVFSPDSALLGKSKEASIKVMSGTATELADPDGKAQGIEMTFKISVTNKTKMGGNTVGVSPSEFRLVLDNNTSITQTNGGYVSAEPESTNISNEITYRIPAGTKPKTLNLFYSETRASVAVELK